jgi:hypothetical protein
MTEPQATDRVKRPRRRGEAIQQLIREYEASGQSRVEFCRDHGVTKSTLDRYLSKRRAAASVSGLVPVEITTPTGAPSGRALVVVLSRGRKVEVNVGFDAATLARLVAVLERV